MSVYGYPADKSICLLQLEISLISHEETAGSVARPMHTGDVSLAGVLQDAVGHAACCVFAIFGR